jgi:hypothetical protein
MSYAPQGVQLRTLSLEAGLSRVLRVAGVIAAVFYGVFAPIGISQATDLGVEWTTTRLASALTFLFLRIVATIVRSVSSSEASLLFNF